jgi:O-antigen ligase
MRQQTTTQADDGSTQSRLVAWRGGLRLIAERPFGAGGGGFHHLSPRYIPGLTEFRSTGRMAPHNSWVLVASEWGLVGLGLFLAFITSTVLTLRRVRRRCSDGDEFFFYRSVAIQVAFAGTLVAATFSDRFYGESIYWMAALAVALERIQYTRLVAAGEAPTLLPPPLDQDEPVEPPETTAVEDSGSAPAAASA